MFVFVYFFENFKTKYAKKWVSCPGTLPLPCLPAPLTACAGMKPLISFALLESPHTCCNSISHWETVEWCWARRLMGHIYTYFRVGSLGLLLWHSSFSGKRSGPRWMHWSEKSAHTLTFCIKITGKCRSPKSLQLLGSSLNYVTNVHLKNSCSYI